MKVKRREMGNVRQVIDGQVISQIRANRVEDVVDPLLQGLEHGYGAWGATPAKCVRMSQPKPDAQRRFQLRHVCGVESAHTLDHQGLIDREDASLDGRRDVQTSLDPFADLKFAKQERVQTTCDWDNHQVFG